MVFIENDKKRLFTMEGGKDYIINKKWDDKNRGPIDIGKVYHINNGVDLQTFDYNKDNYVIDDKDLKENDYFKVVYTGSLRKANNSIMILLNCAKLMQIKYPKVIFLIYGEGTEKEKCIRYCNDNNINNVIFKGFVEKKYIPYILSKCDLNILNCSSNGALKYGGSQNKLFEYLASGHPIISGEDSDYSIVKKYNCGLSRHIKDANDLKNIIINFYFLSEDEKELQSETILATAKKYDYSILAEKLINIIKKV